MKITAAVARGAGKPLALETVELEGPRADEILVRLVASGVCHTDMKARDGASPAPIVLGHEGAGIVVETGAAVRKVRPGDPVVMSYNPCGACPSCREGEPAYCHELGPRNFGGLRPDGTSALSQNGQPIHANFFGQSSFGSFALCTERNVVHLDADVPLELVGPLGCGIQTGAGAVINALRVRPGQSIAVFGAGAVGLSAVMAARLAGAATIIVVDWIEHRLATARELGATHVVNTAREDAAETILGLTGAGVNYALDTSGVVAVMRQAVAVLAPRGTCGIIATPDGPPQDLPVGIGPLLKGRKLRGIIEGESLPDVFIPMLIALQRQGRFPFDRLITFYPFERINDAIRDSLAGDTIKPVLRFPQ